MTRMQVIPAIDLMRGKVVRLTKGDPDHAVFYDDLGTPVEIAQKWKSQGAKRLHIIDLDAALGKPDNLRVVGDIVAATSLPVQVGGGIRSIEAARRLLNSEIDFVILGSLALREPTSVSVLMKEFGSNRVIVALDNKDGLIMVEGWTSSTQYTVMDSLEQYAIMGVKTFLITSIARDGTLSGPDLETLNDACRYPDVNIIAAGGIGDLRDLVALSHTGIWGAIVGKALYEGRFTLEQAIKTGKQEQKACR